MLEGLGCSGLSVQANEECIFFFNPELGRIAVIIQFR